MMFNYDYHYGNESKQYAHFIIPMVLIKNEEFKSLSGDAILLYGLMLNRLSLSQKNGWFDDNNRVFIYYKLENIQEDLKCAHGKGVKLLADLENIGLISRVKQGQGKPTIIYVKKFIETPEKPCGVDGEPDGKASDNKKTRPRTAMSKASRAGVDGDSRLSSTGDIVNDSAKDEVLTSETERSSPPLNADFPAGEVLASEIEKPNLPNTRGAEFPGTARNYNDFSYIKFNDHEISPSDGQDATDTERIISDYAELIKRNICYDDLVSARRFDVWLIDDFVNIMLDVILSGGKYVRINGEDKPRELVKSTMLKINSDDMEHAIDQFKGVTDRIYNKRQYITSLLYNCKLEKGLHYANLVRHDMCG